MDNLSSACRETGDTKSMATTATIHSRQGIAFVVVTGLPRAVRTLDSERCYSASVAKQVLPAMSARPATSDHLGDMAAPALGGDSFLDYKKL